MKNICFIGAFDKLDLIMYISKIMTNLEKKILIIDATQLQKTRYIVPTINPTRSYITRYADIDIAIGFESYEAIERYLGDVEGQSMKYDYALIDADDGNVFCNFNNSETVKNYFVTSFDAYSLKRGIEVISQINVPLRMTRIFYSKEMLKEEEEYFEYLALGLKILWNEEKIYFLLENGDQSAIVENQRIAKIKFRNLSNEYKENVVYLVNDIDSEIGEKKIRTIIKNL